MGIASLVLGIICLLVSFTIFKDLSLICGVIAVVLGIIAIAKQNGRNMAIAGVILSVVGVIVLFSGSNSSLGNKNSATSQNNNVKTKYTLGDTFTFDGYEITTGTNVDYVTVNNQYSEHNNQTVIALPVTIKNNNTETGNLNMFYEKYFGSKGTELDNVDAYFDNSLTDSGDLRPGASNEIKFYLLYDGDGTYAIDFDNYSQKLTLEFNITNSIKEN